MEEKRRGRKRNERKKKNKERIPGIVTPNGINSSWKEYLLGMSSRKTHLPEEGTWTEWLPSKREEKINSEFSMINESDRRQTLLLDENSNVNEVSVTNNAVK